MATDSAVNDASGELTERVMVSGSQRATVAPNLDWAFDFSWVSDDLILQDFATSIRDAASNYLPTRNEFIYRPEGWTALALADYFVLTDNSRHASPKLDGLAYDFSNTKGQERTTLQRMPYLQLAMNPLEIFPHLMVDANTSFVRYGTLSSFENLNTRSLTLGNGIVGVDYARKVSHFNIFARVSSDSLFSSYVADDANLSSDGTASTSLMLTGRVDTRLSRKFGTYLHTVTPRIEYRSIAAQGGTLPMYRASSDNTLGGSATGVVIYYDARTQRRVFHQAQLAIDQSLWGSGAISALPLLDLSVRLPMDLETGKLLQTQVELQWRAPYFLIGNVRTSIAPGQQNVLRELSATVNLNLRYLNVGLGYARWQLNADRFIRSYYELAAPREQATAGLRPIHTLSPSISFNIKQRFYVSYNTDYLLPISDQFLVLDPQNYPNPKENPVNRRGLIEHRASIVYRSPCNCWGITTNMTLPDNEKWFSNKRISILFDVGGYSLGH
ncbi:MAG: LPS assembly protein LptD [Clostridia bacterium]|nr:LPS assembly protein LptD [Deltaproteobacteria bacterium]